MKRWFEEACPHRALSPVGPTGSLSSRREPGGGGGRGHRDILYIYTHGGYCTSSGSSVHWQAQRWEAEAVNNNDFMVK